VHEVLASLQVRFIAVIVHSGTAAIMETVSGAGAGAASAIVERMVARRVVANCILVVDCGLVKY